jgi:transposase
MNESAQLKNCVALVGIDWADKKHDVALQLAGTQAVERSCLEQTPEAIAEWVAKLRQRFGSGRIAVCLEQARGALIYALMAHEHLLLYPLNPQSLAKFRKVLHPSGKKDDPVDADLLLKLLRHFGEQLRPWVPDDVPTRQLRLLVEARRGFVDRRTSVLNELTATLKSYLPQAFVLVGEDLTSAMATDFLKKWNRLEVIQKLTPTVLRAFYYGHNSRSEELIQERLKLIGTAVPLTQDPAIVGALSLAVEQLAAALASFRVIIARYDAEIAQVFAAHPDAFIFQSVDGAGPVLAPRLLVAFGSDRERFADPNALPRYSGTAPVTERSGRHQWVHRRWARPKFMHQSWVEFADQSRRFSAWAGRCYQHLKTEGLGHWAAIRVLAIKWQRILWRCWKERVAYDEAIYLKSLQARGLTLYADLTAGIRPSTHCE